MATIYKLTNSMLNAVQYFDWLCKQTECKDCIFKDVRCPRLTKLELYELEKKVAELEREEKK